MIFTEVPVKSYKSGTRLIMKQNLTSPRTFYEGRMRLRCSIELIHTPYGCEHVVSAHVTYGLVQWQTNLEIAFHTGLSVAI